MQRLAGRVAIVTGAAQGIGGATARRLAEEGARVLVADIDSEGAMRNVETIRQAGGTAEGLECDVGTEAGVRSMVDRALSTWSRVDIVVNNAYSGLGGPRRDAVAETEEAWDRAMDVGLKSMFRMAKLVVPHLQASGGGTIVNMSSVHGLMAEPGQLVYETMKAGVVSLTRQLAVEYGPHGIRVNAICPGHIVTERIAEQWREHPDVLRYFAEQYPLRHTGTPRDIANAVVFLCSDEAAFITGHALVVDGGLTIQLQESFAVRMARYVQANPEPLNWFPY